MSAEPAWDGYFADPFLLRTEDGYAAYGSSEPFTAAGATVRVLTSPDLRSWHDGGIVLRVAPDAGTDVWAPEVVCVDGTYWMYYSAGDGIDGHHLRVATAPAATGPFEDVGVDLTPDELFAIDPHPFQDADGERYLFFARDVLDAERAGTHLAVARMRSMTELDPDFVPVLQPDAAWQLYARDRPMHGRVLDWYTLEGPTVVRHEDGYVLLYSGGSWEGPGYGVSYATASSPLGPWQHAASEGPAVLSSALTTLTGPGHNSVLRLDDGRTVTAFHAWDERRLRRRMHVAELHFRDGRPVVGAPLAP